MRNHAGRAPARRLLSLERMHTHRGGWILGASLLVALGASGCSREDDDGAAVLGKDDAVTAAMADQLQGLALVSPRAVGLEYRLSQPEYAFPASGTEVGVDACQELETRLANMCALFASTLGRSCGAQATFFFAHEQPRCSARVEFWDNDDGDRIMDVYALDLSGQAFLGDIPTCGNGTLDEGEICDDGNREPWDGCDPNCLEEPFNGCETVIENEFMAAEVAWIDRLDWDSPRSHTMVHPSASSLRPVDATLCAAALTAAESSCTRIQSDMPFVSWCNARVESTESGAACAVRLQVGFSRPAPEYGVFTTALNGYLSFTIR